jgi:hypothetical protein
VDRQIPLDITRKKGQIRSHLVIPSGSVVRIAQNRGTEISVDFDPKRALHLVNIAFITVLVYQHVPPGKFYHQALIAGGEECLVVNSPR